MKTSHQSAIAECITKSVGQYFKDLNGEKADDLYHLVLNEVEGPLLRIVMDHADGNQTEAARILGINRNTLRKKLQSNGLTR